MMPSVAVHPPDTAVELVADALSCERDERLLFANLGFRLKAGELLQVEGENGAGKTSLLRILCGLAEPASGEVRWRGQAIRTQRGEFHQELLALGHLSGIKLDLTAIENLRFYVGMSRDINDDALEQALEEVGLSGFEEQVARNLSAGQRRRVALARLSLSQASLWILDEPFTALDRVGIAWLQSTLERHLGRGGLVVLTTHQPLTLEHPVRRLALS